MESMGDLLSRYAPQQQPPEIQAVKQYIAEQFQSGSSVALKGNNLIITVSSASLAAMLRLRTLQIQQVCNTTKRLVFRIG